MTNKERILHMVLDDPKLQELYNYDRSEYEDLSTALYSDNIVVATWLQRSLKISMGLKINQYRKKCTNQSLITYMTIF